MLVALGDDIAALGLDDGWTHMEPSSLWLMDLVPWVLPYLVNVYPPCWVSHENSLNHIFGFLG